MTDNKSNADRLNQLISDINHNIDILVEKFSDDTGISTSDVYVEFSLV